MLPTWARKYIGLPYKSMGRDLDGLDCWGLVRLVMANEFGIDVPSYATEYDDPENPMQVGRLLRRHKDGDASWCEVDSEQPGDIILIRRGEIPFHVGIVPVPGWLLHVERDINTVGERLTVPHIDPCIFGIFRHAELAA